MITSMTGFAHSELQHATGHYSIEMRSLNQRYLELNLRLPDNFRCLEGDMREQLRKYIARGKIECILTYTPAENSSTQILVNHELVKQLLQAHQDIATQITQKTEIDILELMHWPGVLISEQPQLDTVQPELIKLFHNCLQQFLQDKRREGHTIRGVIEKRVATMQQYMQELTQLIADLMNQHRNKLLARVEQFNIELEPLRLEQEVVLLAQRADVAEEVDRLTTHIEELQAALQIGGAVGRRFDFLLQEMLRETNTLGAKATDIQLSRIIIELKVLIEQIREQIQNIE